MRFSILSACAFLSTAPFAAAQSYPPLCGNSGLSWAEYPNPAGNNPDSTYSTFNPTVFKTLQPNFSGLTYTVGGYFANNDAIPVSVYGSGYNFTSRIFAISHRGYFFVPVTGNYTISTNAVDDILLAWVGPNAYSGFTRQNAVLSNTWNANAATYTFSATAGQYVPIRFLLGQGYGGWGLSMMLLGPNNTNIITSGQSSTRWLVQYVCGKDKSIAPPYPPFGSET